MFPPLDWQPPIVQFVVHSQDFGGGGVLNVTGFLCPVVFTSFFSPKKKGGKVPLLWWKIKNEKKKESKDPSKESTDKEVKKQK